MQCVAPLAFFNLDAIKEGKLMIAEPIKDLFKTNFVGFDFSMGTFFIVAMVIMAAYIVAPIVGEYLSEKDIPSWVYTVASIAILVGWFLC